MSSVISPRQFNNIPFQWPIWLPLVLLLSFHLLSSYYLPSPVLNLTHIKTWILWDDFFFLLPMTACNCRKNKMVFKFRGLGSNRARIWFQIYWTSNHGYFIAKLFCFHCPYPHNNCHVGNEHDPTILFEMS